MHDEIEDALSPILSRLSPLQKKQIQEAVHLRRSLLPLPLPILGLPRPDDATAIVELIARMRLDAPSILAGLLSPLFKQNLLPAEVIRETWDEETLGLCEIVAKLPTFTPLVQPPTKAANRKIAEQALQEQAETFRKMLLAMSRDIRVILVLLCDRLHQLRILEFLPVEEQIQIAHECREVFAPLANRLGIAWIKNEMEDLSLRYLHPTAFYDLVAKVAVTKRERDQYILEVQEILHSLFQKHEIPVHVAGRSKHINSIFRKLDKKESSYDQLFDILAFRVICQTKDQCYQILGFLHAKWKPIPGRFKDYIALPKPNGYRSLHTTILGPHQKLIEIQIRTEEMHHLAEDGIAAHWLYKEQGNPQASAVEQFQWLRSLLAVGDDASDPQALMAHVLDHLSEGEVFVFTPQGQVKELPKGATPVDFAYAVHTRVGDRCIGAKVNAKIVPLRTPLHNGDIVEILTSPTATPKRDWLTFVQTNRARAKIRNFLRSEQKQQALAIGKDLLEKKLPSGHRSIPKLLKSGALSSLLQELSCATQEELLMQIGYGKLDAQTVVDTLFPPDLPTTPPPEEIRSVKPLRKPSKSGLVVGGMQDILVRLGGCCKPIPGDPIVGLISRGRGVIVHRFDCPKIQDTDPERLVEIAWDAQDASAHSISLRVTADNRPGLLTQMSRVFTDLQIDISAAHCQTVDQQAINTFQCSIRDVKQLDKLTRLLEDIKGVLRVERLRQ